MNIPRLQTLKGSLTPPPDRLQAGAAALLAALSNGSSRLSPWPDYGDFRLIQLWLEQLQIEQTKSDSSLEIVGLAGRKASPPKEPLTISTHSGVNFLWTSWLTAELGSTLQWSGRPALLQRLELDLAEVAALRITSSGTLLTVERIAEPTASHSTGTLLRHHHLVLSLLNRQSFEWEEQWISADPLSPLLREFGANIDVEEYQELDSQQNSGLEQLQALLQSLDDGSSESEQQGALEKRLMRLSRRRPEKRARWSLHPPYHLNGADISLLGDPAIGGLIALLGGRLPQSQIELEQLCVTPTRAGIYTALSRLGGDHQRSRERKLSGENSATIRVRYNSEQLGRRFSLEQVETVGEELPLLAVAAAFSPEETIFRGLNQLKSPFWGVLVQNLREAGVDVGEFEDGIVLRGRDQLDGSLFFSDGEPAQAWAAVALAYLGHGQSSIDSDTATLLTEIWPNWHQTITGLQEAT